MEVNKVSTNDEFEEFLNREDVEKESGETYPAWNGKDNKDFKKGSHLLGVLVEKRVNVGPNNQSLYVIEKRGGDKVSLWGSSLIDSRLENKAVGQEMAIVYKGKTKSEKTGREYHDFDFYFAKYKGSPDIDQMLEEVGLTKE